MQKTIGQLETAHHLQLRYLQLFKYFDSIISQEQKTVRFRDLRIFREFRNIRDFRIIRDFRNICVAISATYICEFCDFCCRGT